MKKQNKKKKGFTLIELIIVLAVMAIIGAIAIPNFAAVRDNSKYKADVQSLETIKRQTLALVADETLSTGITITFDKGGSAGAFKGSVANTAMVGEDEFKAAMKDVKALQFGKEITYDSSTNKYTKGTDAGTLYKVTITSTGDVTVEVTDTAAGSNVL